MSAALLGLLSAAGLGTADFMARFSARALGAPLTYAIVLLVGAVGSTLWLAASGQSLVWSPVGWALAGLHGASVATMCMLLYVALARGPVAIVAPIVASHPALVLAANVMMGVRPGPLQWAAMAMVVLGSVLIARCAGSHPDAAGGGQREMRKTVLIAFAACLAYVLLVLTGQAAAPLIGDLQTIALGRWAGLAFVAVVLLIQRVPLRIPADWAGFVLAQGVLDGIGYFAFLAGALTAAPHVAMVVASSFSVFTVILAKLILHEPISRQQAAAIALIALGTAALAGVS